MQVRIEDGIYEITVKGVEKAGHYSLQVRVHEILVFCLFALLWLYNVGLHACSMVRSLEGIVL